MKKSFNLHDVILTVLMYLYFLCLFLLLTHSSSLIPLITDNRIKRPQVGQSVNQQNWRLSQRLFFFQASVTPSPCFPISHWSLNLKTAAVLHRQIVPYTWNNSYGFLVFCPRTQFTVHVPPESKLSELVGKRLRRKIKCSWTVLVPFHCLSIRHECSFHKESDSVPPEYVKTGGLFQGFMGCPVFPTYLQWFRQYAWNREFWGVRGNSSFTVASLKRK